MGNKANVLKKPSSAAPAPTYDSREAEKIIHKMLLIRLVEEEIIARYGAAGQEQKMRCPVHLSIGQEAAAVGACHHLTAEDTIFSTHRCHAHYLAKGGDVGRMVLELYGKMGGCLDGRGGSMHLMDDAAGATMSVPIVSSSIPLAVGAALAGKIDGRRNVALAFFGDASVEEGVFHESMNFSSVQQLPVIFVCENNQYSVYTHISARQPDRPLANLGPAHKMHTVTVDGSNPFMVAETFNELITEAKEANRPSFVVLETYRWREHCGVNFDDHLGYRDEKEFLRWQEKDPVQTAIRAVTADGMLTEAKIQTMQERIKAEVAKAFDAAEKAPLPTPDMAGRFVYAE